MAAQAIDILMYHSISNGQGPTSITPSTFREQMAVLAEAGFQAVTVGSFIEWARGQIELPAKSVVLTFDDGFADFADVAFPELRQRNWPAVVYIPTGKMGGFDDWESERSRGRPRPLMSWPTIKMLAESGIDFGGHGVLHRDLTKLALLEARDEIVRSAAIIAEQLGRAPTSFAAPFGSTNPFVDAEIRKVYQASVTTELGRAGLRSDRFKLPRIEMWYFRDVKRWREFLRGSRGYFTLRQAARAVRGFVGLC